MSLEFDRLVRHPRRVINGSGGVIEETSVGALGWARRAMDEILGLVAQSVHADSNAPPVSRLSKAS
jgi:hypothetical protein